MAYERHWTLSVLTSVSLIFSTAMLYSKITTSVVDAIVGTSSIGVQEVAIIASLSVATAIFAAIAAAVWYFLDMMITAIVITFLVIMIAGSAINSFYLNTSPLS